MLKGEYERKNLYFIRRKLRKPALKPPGLNKSKI